MGEVKSAMEDALGINSNPPDKPEITTRVDMLNADQRHVFDRLKQQFFTKKDMKMRFASVPLRMFISGVGGTGKSFLIETVRALIANIWPEHDYTCAITAPTGIASFNVLLGGITVHLLFPLPIEHEGKTAGYWSLPKISQKTLKVYLRYVKVIVVDEVSMLSSLNLAYLHLRLEELFGSNDWFGGKNI